MQVRAAVVRKPGDKFVIETLQLRSPLDDEVLVKVQCSGLCGCDVHYMNDSKEPHPIVMGHEGAGIIEQIGKSVKNFNVGDHVIIATNHCGHCQNCKDGKLYDCDNVFNFWYGKQVDRKSPLSTLDGKEITAFSCHATFADHAVVRVNTLVKVSDNVDLRHVCFLGCCPITGAGGVINYFNAQPGQTIVITGMGTVGLTAVMAAKIKELKHIVAIDRHPEKLELAKKFGATVLINPNEDPELRALGEFVKNNGPLDFAADTTGNKGIAEKLDNYLSPNTMRYDINGSIEQTSKAKWPFACIGNSVKDTFIPEMIKYYQEGSFPLNEFLTYYKFDDINKAYDDLVGKKVIRPILTFD